MTEEALLPCPFCGRIVKFDQTTSPSLYIKCECGIETRYFGFNWESNNVEESYNSYLQAKKDIIKLWNTRI